MDSSLYNGEEDQPDISEQRLSDAFIHKADKPEIELTCTVYNIAFLSHYDEVQKVVELDYTFENRLRMNYRDAKEEGKIHQLINQISRKISKAKTEDEIIDELEDTYENIHPIYDYIISHPDESVEQITDVLCSKTAITN